MIDYRTWVECDGKMPTHLPQKPLETNQEGGFNPETNKQVKRFKHADLITLPKEVKGTNCGNCSFMKKQGKYGFCKHEEIQDWVTDRMCCKYWNHHGVKRSWGKNSDGT